MFNFVALASDPGNEWLASLNVGTINAHLAARRREFQAKLNTGEYWLMNKTHREAISPEVRSVGVRTCLHLPRGSSFFSVCFCVLFSLAAPSC
eukprot:SAG31_NODE_590_length_13794_cov_22.123695_3_plen_93_part_00